MAVLAVQTITSAGLGAAYSAATGGGDTITDQAAVGTGGLFLHVKNGAASAVTVTIADPGATPMGRPGNPAGVSVPAAGDRMIAVSVAAWNPTTAAVAITYSSATSVTVAAIRR